MVNEVEQFVDLDFCENRFSVSNFGRIRCNSNGKIRLGNPTTTSPYLYISIRVNGRSRHFSVHRLVAMAFIPYPDNKPQVNHIDGNKQNNLASNLEWATQSENMQHCYDSGLKKYRPLHYKGKTGAEHNRSKAVKCSNGIVYGSISEASRITNCSISGVWWSVKNKKPIRGLQFDYA